MSQTLEERLATLETELRLHKEACAKGGTVSDREVKEMKTRIKSLENWRSWVAGGASVLGFLLGIFGKKLIELFPGGMG